MGSAVGDPDEDAGSRHSGTGEILTESGSAAGAFFITLSAFRASRCANGAGAVE